VVMTVSSKYSPVPSFVDVLSFVDVPAHPSKEASRMANMNVTKLLASLMAILLQGDFALIPAGDSNLPHTACIDTYI